MGLGPRLSGKESLYDGCEQVTRRYARLGRDLDAVLTNRALADSERLAQIQRLRSQM